MRKRDDEDRGWFIGNLLLPTWRRALADGRAADGSDWKRWTTALLLGYAAAGGAAAIAVATARYWLHRGLETWDQQTLADLASSGFSFPQALWFEAWGSSAFLVPMLLVAVVLLVQRGYLFRALTLVVAYAANKGLVLGAWQLWNRARPEMIAEGIAAPGLHAFPSGHAVNATVLFGLLGVYWWRASPSGAERGIAVAVVSVAVLMTCLGRLRLGTHWPSDVIAGVLIGLVWLTGLVIAVALAERGLVRPPGQYSRHG